MGLNRKSVTTINKEGKSILLWSLLLFCAVNTLMFIPFACKWFSYFVLSVSSGLLLIIINFFRNPKRRFPSEDTEKVVVAPADGVIVAIEEVDEPDYFHDRRIVISTFMSVLNVHANWFPVNGLVKKVEHQKGSFHAAYKAKSSFENERSLVVIETPEGHEILVRQIAGALARRVVTYPQAGDKCHIDEHLGFIKLGSRVDIYLPLDSLICVKMKQKVMADNTILAKLP